MHLSYLYMHLSDITSECLEAYHLDVDLEIGYVNKREKIKKSWEHENYQYLPVPTAPNPLAPFSPPESYGFSQCRKTLQHPSAPTCIQKDRQVAGEEGPPAV